MTTTVPRPPVLARPRYRDIVAQLAAAQKSNSGAPAYSRFVNRPLGRRLAAAAYLLGLTPNAVTAISASFSAAGLAIVALVRPQWWTGVLVAVLLVIGYALDAADGQLARLQGGGSHAGEWLDHVVDAAKCTLLHIVVLIAAYRYFDLSPKAWLLVPLGYLVVDVVVFFATILNDLLRARFTARTGAAVERAQPSTLRSLLALPTDYGVVCLMFLALGAPTVFFGIYCFFFVANAGFLFLASMKWFKDMSALDRPAVAR